MRRIDPEVLAGRVFWRVHGSDLPAFTNEVGQLASVELEISGSHRRGRVFLPVQDLNVGRLLELAALFNRVFIESHEEKRFSLLERALSQPVVTVETYPGETAPQELHVYLRAAQVSEHPIFGCVLAPPSVARRLASQSPHVAMETASFQIMEGDVTGAQILAAIEVWTRRVWPALRVPALRFSPPGPIEPKERALGD